VITLDTSAVLALGWPSDAHHGAASATVAEDGGPYIVPAGILAEVAYMMETAGYRTTLELLLDDLHSGSLSLRCGEEDLPRIGALIGRYADLPLGFADATVVACAEANGGRVLTFDRRDFRVVAAEGTIQLEPSA